MTKGARGSGMAPDYDPVGDRLREREAAAAGLYSSAAPAPVTEHQAAPEPERKQRTATRQTPRAAAQPRKQTQQPKEERRVSPVAADLPMPPVRPRKVARTQLNTRVRADIDALLADFVKEQETALQDTVDLALLEFLNRRGYRLPDQPDEQ